MLRVLSFHCSIYKVHAASLSLRWTFILAHPAALVKNFFRVFPNFPAVLLHVFVPTGGVALTQLDKDTTSGTVCQALFSCFVTKLSSSPRYTSLLPIIIYNGTAAHAGSGHGRPPLNRFCFTGLDVLCYNGRTSHPPPGKEPL